MRSKASHVGEGGVSCGLGVIDSPFIVASQVFRNSESDGVKGTVQF